MQRTGGKMKRPVMFAILFLFVMSSAVCMAGGIDKTSGCKTSSGASGASKRSVFQKAKNEISTWDKTAPQAEQESLRENRAELRRRRSRNNYIM